MHAPLLTLLLSSTVLAQPVLGPPRKLTPSLASEGQRQADVAAAADRYLVTWQAGAGGRAAVRAARVGLDGVSLDPSGFDVARAAGGQFEPAVAFAHDTFLVVYSDMRGGDHALRARRVTLQGSVLDEGGIPLSVEPTAGRMGDVAATTEGFVAAWCQAEPTGRGLVVRARRLGPDGQPVDAEPLRVTDVTPWAAGEDFGHHVLRETICQHVQIAVQGSLAMIVWGGTAGREQGYFIERAVLDLSSGALAVAPGKAVVGAQSRIYNPVVAPVGAGFVFAWTDSRSRGGTGLPDQNFGALDVAGASVYGSLDTSGSARIVLEPAVTSGGLIAFVTPYANPARDRRVEWQLKLRRVLPDATSPGEDLEVEGNAAWPALATHTSSTSLLVYTRVNAAEDNGMLFARVVTP